MLNREYRAELLRKYARSAEDDELLARVLDKIDIRERSGRMQHSRFLSERDRLCIEPVLRELGTTAVFWGGCPEAERTVFILPADWQTEEQVRTGEDSPVCVLRAHWRGAEGLGHRDFLGALMALGIERDLIGDIIPREGSCDIVLLREIAPYVLQNLSSAGRTALTLEEIPEAEAREAEFRLIRDTVASLRLDAIVGSGFSLSREKASAAIRAGRVTLNGMECLKPDKPVEAGSKISLRGLGKIRLAEAGGLSRKGRTQVLIHRFV
ncbi:MAG: RNA-binding protein [Oscillospiraceae bacterium]|nr:RNA-binding protein [Oscillospiraceae bacterium]